MTTLTLNIKSAQDKISSLEVKRLNFKIIYLLGIFTIIFMLFLYVFLVNNLTGGVYLIKNYNKELNLISNQNKTLETNFAKINFLNNISEGAKAMSFEKTKNIKYIQILENSLAKK